MELEEKPAAAYVCAPGGLETTIVALNKLTGETVLKNYVPERAGGNANRARNLAHHHLKQKNVELNEAACLLGFEDANSFYRAFQIGEGTTPSECEFGMGCGQSRASLRRQQQQKKHEQANFRKMQL